MKQIEVPFSWKGQTLKAYVQIKENKKSVKVRWDPGTVDYLGDFDSAFTKLASELFGAIGDLIRSSLEKARKDYQVKDAESFFSFRWGWIRLHKDQLEEFMGEFIPAWRAGFERVMAEAAKQEAGK